MEAEAQSPQRMRTTLEHNGLIDNLADYAQSERDRKENKKEQELAE